MQLQAGARSRSSASLLCSWALAPAFHCSRDRYSGWIRKGKLGAADRLQALCCELGCGGTRISRKHVRTRPGIGLREDIPFKGGRKQACIGRRERRRIGGLASIESLADPPHLARHREIAHTHLAQAPIHVATEPVEKRLAETARLLLRFEAA